METIEEYITVAPSSFRNEFSWFCFTFVPQPLLDYFESKPWSFSIPSVCVCFGGEELLNRPVLSMQKAVSIARSRCRDRQAAAEPPPAAYHCSHTVFSSGQIPVAFKERLFSFF
jgi:hypothetical protein|uniref:Uncharacterized protein n=1 Tax=Mus musculus TaxID=10090 RepID=Q3UN48_MOUSE|nr:unnamed protein product [Mus musculus]